MNSGRIQVFHGGLVRLNIILYLSRGSRQYLVLGLYFIIIEYINRTALSCTYNCIINILLSTSTCIHSLLYGILTPKASANAWPNLTRTYNRRPTHATCPSIP